MGEVVQDRRALWKVCQVKLFGDKTAPNRPNSGSSAVKVAATSQRESKKFHKTHGEIFFLAENFRGP